MSNPVSHRKVLLWTGFAAVVMFGFCFAMVPLYSILCKKVGLNTAINNDLITAKRAVAGNPDATREVIVQFVTVRHLNLPWEFYPRVQSIRVHPGETAKVMFHAKNTTNKTMTVQAIPSITPFEAISHFHKIECFCFSHQRLASHQGKEMPLIFTLSKDLPQHVHVISLAYTLFDVTGASKVKGS